MKHIFILFFLLISSYSKGQIISTFAGNGTFGSSGIGGPATVAQLSFPMGVVSDNSGNIIFLEPGTSHIRIINSAGIINNFAGTGEQGYTGDGGPALLARLAGSHHMVRDKTGNLFFVDQDGNVIRKIDPSGIITSVTGNLPLGYSGDGGPLAQAQFNKISDIALDDAGNLYIADSRNYVVRKVNTSGIISTIAGNGTAGFSGDGGPAINATFFFPISVAADKAGNIYIGDFYNHRVRKVNTSGIISTYAGNGSIGYPGDGVPATSAGIEEPLDLAFDNADNLYIADRIKWVVRKINTSGIISTYAGSGGGNGYSGDGGPAILAGLRDPVNISFDDQNNLYISQEVYHVIRKVTSCLASVVVQSSNLQLCNNNNGTFTISANNVVSYRWQVNSGSGWNDLVDNAVYSGTSTNTLNITAANVGMNNNLYRCRLQNGCGDIFSQPAVLFVSDPSPATVSISTPQNTVCMGANTMFTAIHVNGGNAPIFEWMKNGIQVGTNSNTYIDNRLISGDIISCRLTSNSNCVTTNTSISNEIVMVVNPMPSDFLPNDTTICSYSSVLIKAQPGYVGYQWNTNINTSSISITQPGLYWVEVIDQNSCKARDTIIIMPVDCLRGIYVPTAFSPNDDGKNDIFKPVVYEKLTKYFFRIYNRYGQNIFETSDINKGWDGKLRGTVHGTNVFTWICDYQTERGFTEILKGTVIIIR